MGIRQLPSLEWKNEKPKAKCWIVTNGEKELACEHDYFENEEDFHAWADETRNEIFGLGQSVTVRL